MNRLSILFLFMFFTHLLFAQTEISIDSVSAYTGQHIKVCSLVTDIYQPKGDNKLTYINFGGRYPDHTFTVVIFAKDLPNFPSSPVEKYINQKVCITGMAADYKGKPQIVAKFPDQITIQYPLRS